MLVFGHTGITLGVAVLVSGVCYRRCQQTGAHNRIEEYSGDAAAFTSAKEYDSGNIVSWVKALGRHVDIRLLLVASLLPDIIDKPLGMFIFRETFSSGRIFCHTLLFLILLTIAGVWLYRSRGKLWMLVISFGVLTHIIFDRMWCHYETVLWPGFGFAFKRMELTDWEMQRLEDLFSLPSIYVPEIVGILILLWFTWVLVRNGSFQAFIKSGRVS